MYICEMYILADINKIVENQDLYRNKDDFWIFLKTKSSYILILKILYLMNKSVKCLNYKVTYNAYIRQSIQYRKSGL